jgi:hypothetical protein
MVVLVGCATQEPVWSDGVHLSTEGLYESIDDKLLAPDTIELRPAFALWSDGAEKHRWLLVPPGQAINTRNMDHWQLPVGSKLFKEFRVDGRRVETRLIERVNETQYRFMPYQWLADESDAIAVPDGAIDVLGTTHDIPSQATCMTCHQSEPGRALGVSAIQLSAMLDELPLAQRPTRRYELIEPALGVLHANCGHCHTRGGIAEFQQLRVSIADVDLPVDATAPFRSIVGAPLTHWTASGFVYRVVRGDPEASAIHHRMANRSPGVQMPPLGTDVVDEAALHIVDDWIRSL